VNESFYPPLPARRGVCAGGCVLAATSASNGMTDEPFGAQQYQLDRPLLDEHGPSYIDMFAEGMRAESRTTDIDDAMRQCDRMRAILLSDRDLAAYYEATGGEAGDPWAKALIAEVERRGLDT
jgi:hypothetical protein